MIDSDISNEEFMLLINDEQNYFKWKESIRAKDNQISDKEWDKLTEHRKMAGQIKSKYQDLRKRPKHKTYWNYKTMLLYCFKCRKNTESKEPSAFKTSNRKTMLVLRCEACDNKKPKFIKEQEASGSMSQLGIRSPWKILGAN